MKLAIIALALFSLSAAAGNLPKEKSKKDAFCEAVSKHYEAMESDTGMDLEACKASVSLSEEYVGRSLFIMLKGQVEMLHLEDSWINECSVKVLMVEGVGAHVMGNVRCEPLAEVK